MKLQSLLDQVMKHPKAALYIPCMDRLWLQLSGLSIHLLSTLTKRRHPCLVIVIILSTLVEDISDELFAECPLISAAKRVSLVGPNQVCILKEIAYR